MPRVKVVPRPQERAARGPTKWVGVETDVAVGVDILDYVEERGGVLAPREREVARTREIRCGDHLVTLGLDKKGRLAKVEVV